MSDIMLYLIKAVIVVSITIVMRYFIPWIREKIEASQYAWVAEWAATAVNAIQQTNWNKTGSERKAKVVELLKALLIKKNIAISDAELDAIIEAAVWAMKQTKKEE
nr:MAG TPA: holin [Caudoviricetes sp.]